MLCLSAIAKSLAKTYNPIIQKMRNYLSHKATVFLIGVVSLFIIGMGLLVWQIRCFATQTATQIAVLGAQIRPSSEECDTLIDAIPFVADKPGRYCLASSLDASESEHDAITIESDDVTIDGRGYTITGSTEPATLTRGILAIDQNRLTIKNVRLFGFRSAIVIGTTDKIIPESTMYSSDRKSRDIVIREVRADNPTFQGVHVRADNFKIHDCSVSGVGPSTYVKNAFATGIYGKGNGCSIEDNLVMLGEPTGTGENVGIALYYGAGCRVEGNTITFDRLPEFGRNYGIWTRPSGGSLPLVANNFISGSHFALGPHGMFYNNKSANTICSMFTKRPSSADTLQDLGKNESFSSPGNPRPGDVVCYADPEAAIERFRSNPSPDAAYAVATAYGETDPIGRQAEMLAWIFVAARMHHSGAVKIAEEPEDHYPPAIVKRAKKLVPSLLPN